VPAALMNAIGAAPEPGGNLTPWEIIEAARAHLAEQRQAEAEPEALPATTAWPGSEPEAAQPGTTAWPESEPGPARSPEPGVRPTTVPPTAAAPPGSRPTTVPPTAGAPDTEPRARGGGIVEAYGIAFLPGADDVELLLTELRRRGKWARSLRGQEVSSASAPAVLLVGDACSGQRRLSRMIARALAEADVSSGDVRAVDADELADTDPRRLRDRIEEHSGHTLLIEGLDALILDDDRGAAYAAALYRARVEGVSGTTVTATCAPERLRALTQASPELVTGLRSVRLPDLSEPRARADLAALLAGERHLELTAGAWQVARRDLGVLRGRGRLTNARLVEAYLDRACSRHLSQAGETQVFRGEGAMTLTPEDFEGVAAELES
jgi:hypothetical protein